MGNEIQPDFGCHFRENVRRWSFGSPYYRAFILKGLLLEIGITKGILTSSRVKAKLFRTFKKTKNPQDYAKFKIYRDTINSLSRKSKKQYHKEYFIKHANNLKKAWKGINNLLNRQGKLNVSDIFLNINGEVITDQKNCGGQI